MRHTGRQQRRRPAHDPAGDPATWQLSNGASYVHLSAATRPSTAWKFHTLPDLKALGSRRPAGDRLLLARGQSRPVDWSRVSAWPFAGAQKNLGPAGLTLVIVREDLLGHALPVCPSAFRLQDRRRATSSMYNTPPTWGHLHCGPDLPMAAAARRRLERHRCHGAAQPSPRPQLLYGCIDQLAACT
jgi:phosphoserine aminotransferase